MPISVICPSCACKLRAPDNMAGRKTKCPKCGTGIVVPHTSAESPQPHRQEPLPQAITDSEPPDLPLKSDPAPVPVSSEQLVLPFLIEVEPGQEQVFIEGFKINSNMPKQAVGFISAELIQDTQHPNSFIVITRWRRTSSVEQVWAQTNLNPYELVLRLFFGRCGAGNKANRLGVYQVIV